MQMRPGFAALLRQMRRRFIVKPIAIERTIMQRKLNDDLVFAYNVLDKLAARASYERDVSEGDDKTRFRNVNRKIEKALLELNKAIARMNDNGNPL